jgi:hypothetical protein
VAQTVQEKKARKEALAPRGDGFKAARLDRRVVDLLISWMGAVVAVALIALGAAAIYGGTFAMDNVKDRLEPQNIAFPPAEAMSPEETAEVGEFAGQAVEDGVQAEAYSRYIGLHLKDPERFPIADGQTFAELGAVERGLRDEIAEAEAAGDPAAAGLQDELAAVSAERDTIFKGETLRAILLNAYGWWTVGQITFWAGIGAVIAGLILVVFVALGFRHARRATGAVEPAVA